MSDRINRLTVILDADWRDDDVENVIKAIKMIKGVLTVDSNIADAQDYMAIERAKLQIREKIAELLYKD